MAWTHPTTWTPITGIIDKKICSMESPLEKKGDFKENWLLFASDGFSSVTAGHKRKVGQFLSSISNNLEQWKKKCVINNSS
ncbi:hypothetical protein WA026_004857 [Henosepilachna vigintioctopunctata]|uniref:PPM-type phosphatase domain-containing protein n=1 Tax=Henosepilachna vigintioctopunctata TaxID=420089 RepID=A0AAW1UST6_9CUCU